MQRKRWVALVILPALLLTGDFFYWRLAVSDLRARFMTWTARSRASGWDVRHGAITMEGWPDSATLRVENLTVAASDIFGQKSVTLGGLRLDRMGWGSDAVLVRAGLTRPNTLEITPVGLRALRINNSPPIPVSADHVHLRLTMRLNALPETADFDAVTLSGSIPGLGSVNIGHLSAHVDLNPDTGRDQAVIAFSVSARSVSLPDRLLGLEPETGEMALDGVLNGHWPPIGVSSSQDLTARAISWRDTGGSLELHRLVIGWGRVRLDATATLALDEDLQPMGAGNGRIVGYGAALDALAKNAVLTPSAAKASKAVLSLMANTPVDGHPEEVDVPMILQFRTLSVRQVPLVRLPELDWPAR